MLTKKSLCYNENMKKIFCFLTAVFMMAGVLITSGFTSENAMAACTNSGGSKDGKEVAENTFLGLRPWYYKLELDDSCSPVVPGDTKDEFTGFVWTIILNIVFDLFMVVGVIATGFLIYGGYIFLTSGGDPAKAGKAKKALTGAIIGILVALSATIIINTITGAIGLQEENG